MCDLRLIDPYFIVYGRGYEPYGDTDSPPASANECEFFVMDAEGQSVTEMLPWHDAMWVCRALNEYTDREIESDAGRTEGGSA